MKRIILILLLPGVIFTAGCLNSGKNNPKKLNNMIADSSSLYGYNREFLKKHTEVIELKMGNAAVLLAPSWQGRVMTSTAAGESGYSFGWINHKLISTGEIMPHINAFGGEERLWLGPEGGQFSIFFGKGKDFTFENWQTPDFIDTKPYQVVSSSQTSAEFHAEAEIENYTGTKFSLTIGRKVVLLHGEELNNIAGINTDGLNCVAYLSENKIINTGKSAWKKETGLLSIWMLGMFNPSPSVAVVIPVKDGDEGRFGVKVNDNYFGKIAGDRLKVVGNHIFFRADGKSRGKIGISPLRAAGTMGSYDSQNNVLTLLICKLPEGITDYVNSAWKIQDDPFSGDAYNSYNDGPLEDGTQMGPFYELETSSPAVALSPGEELIHTQITVHLTGDRKLLDRVSVKILGMSLDKIETVFKD